MADSAAQPADAASQRRFDGRGVITFAYGDNEHVRQARALALSIRRADRDMPLAVASDRPAAEFGGLFDVVIPWPFRDYPGMTAKLSLARMTPFASTLYIDSDCMCVRPVAAVFDYFDGQDFAVYGGNPPLFRWADGSDHIRAIVDAETYPTFNGGLIFFNRSALADDVLARARGFSEHYDRLNLDRPRGRHNEELLISLAMASRGLRATDAPSLVPMVAPQDAAQAITLDLLNNRCGFDKDGGWVEPAIVHFVGARDRMIAYRRERLVLELIVGRGWPRWTRPLLGLTAAVTYQTARAKGKAARLWAGFRSRS